MRLKRHNARNDEQAGNAPPDEPVNVSGVMQRREPEPGNSEQDQKDSTGLVAAGFETEAPQ